MMGPAEQIGTLQGVVDQIERAERFVLTSHARPDGDAVGSVLGCWQVLDALIGLTMWVLAALLLRHAMTGPQ